MVLVSNNRFKTGPGFFSKLELGFFFFKQPDPEPNFWFHLCVKLEPKLRFWGKKGKKHLNSFLITYDTYPLPWAV
jgi:hypothetical protein